jgi:GTPase KRas protein
MYGAPYASPAQRSPYASPTSPSSRPQNIPIVIVGNKRDLTRGREVSPEDGARLAQRLGCEFFETSAKTGYNVENAFRSIVRGIKASKGGGGQPDGRTQEGGGGGVMAGTKKSKRSGRKCVIL